METAIAKSKAKLFLRHSFYLIFFETLTGKEGHLWNVFLFSFLPNTSEEKKKIWSTLERNMIEQGSCFVFQAQTQKYG